MAAANAASAGVLADLRDGKIVPTRGAITSAIQGQLEGENASAIAMELANEVYTQFATEKEAEISGTLNMLVAQLTAIENELNGAGTTKEFVTGARNSFDEFKTKYNRNVKELMNLRKLFATRPQTFQQIGTMIQTYHALDRRFGTLRAKMAGESAGASRHTLENTKPLEWGK